MWLLVILMFLRLGGVDLLLVGVALLLVGVGLRLVLDPPLAILDPLAAIVLHPPKLSQAQISPTAYPNALPLPPPPTQRHVQP